MCESSVLVSLLRPRIMCITLPFIHYQKHLAYGAQFAEDISVLSDSRTVGLDATAFTCTPTATRSKVYFLTSTGTLF